MREYDKEVALKIIVSAAKEYDKKLNNKHFLIVYQDGSSVRKLSHPTNKVLAIFRKEYNQQNYTRCTYLSKGQQIQKLQIPDDIKELILFENMGRDVEE